MSGSLYAKENGYDMFGDDDSSDDNLSSSEDEIDIILHGTPEQRRKLQDLHKKWLKGADNTGLEGNDSSSSEDEFEKEMEAELSSHIKSLEESRDKLSISEGCSQSPSNAAKTALTKSNAVKTSADEFYDDVYFDSDEEMEEISAQGKPKHKVISNDDLLYDPDMDDRDQRWVDQQRQSHRRYDSGKPEKKTNSDALLDCPACMTTLCIDCQRHEIHKNQYRAMFVMNCTVDSSETLECPEQSNKKRKKKSKNVSKPTKDDSSCSTKDLFHPVRCLECNTVVGVYDSDEVYHFFNVLASYT